MRAFADSNPRENANSVMSPQQLRTRNATQLLGGYTHNGPVNQSANVSKKNMNRLHKDASGIHLPNLGRTISHSLTPHANKPSAHDTIA